MELYAGYCLATDKGAAEVLGQVRPLETIKNAWGVRGGVSPPPPKKIFDFGVQKQRFPYKFRCSPRIFKRDSAAKRLLCLSRDGVIVMAWCRWGRGTRPLEEVSLESQPGELGDAIDEVASSSPAHSEHKAITSNSGASSSMKADSLGLAKRTVVQPLVTHQFDEMVSFFAMAASCWSHTPRPWRRWACHCIS